MLECSSPFLVNLLTAFKDAQHLYMLMELVQGGEFFTYLQVGVQGEQQGKDGLLCQLHAAKRHKMHTWCVLCCLSTGPTGLGWWSGVLAWCAWGWGFGCWLPGAGLVGLGGISAWGGGPCKKGPKYPLLLAAPEKATLND
jgi:hypothetical protein